jgi:hypothetical protein
METRSTQGSSPPTAKDTMHELRNRMRELLVIAALVVVMVGTAFIVLQLWGSVPQSDLFQDIEHFGSEEGLVAGMGVELVQVKMNVKGR